jgi:hypothetical protein
MHPLRVDPSTGVLNVRFRPVRVGRPDRRSTVVVDDQNSRTKFLASLPGIPDLDGPGPVMMLTHVLPSLRELCYARRVWSGTILEQAED